MRVDQVVEGLRDLFGVEPDLSIPDDSGKPWLTVRYGDDPGDLYGVLKARIAGRDIVVKVNPAQGIGQTLIPWIIREQNLKLPAAYGSFPAAAQTSDTLGREPAAYRVSALHDMLPQEMGRFTHNGQTALVLEDLGEISGLDPSGAIERWPTQWIEKALIAAAGFHAATVGRDFAWTTLRPSTTTESANVALWRAILEDAARRFPDDLPAETLAVRLRTLEDLPDWHRAKDAMPACLVHNDFNQRNVGFRRDGRPVALDWELACVNTPQRDVAELLTFTLDAHTQVDEVLHLLATHWQALSDNGLDVDPELYAAAAAAEFKVMSVDRMGLHLLFASAFDLPYVSRINRTVDHLVRLTGV